MNCSKKHFVTFLSPGTFFNESTTKEISSLDINEAKTMAGFIYERYGTHPYAFYFTTKELQGTGWYMKQVEIYHSPTYYIRGIRYTLNDIIERNIFQGKYDILISNMMSNEWTHVVEVNGQFFPIHQTDEFIVS